MRRVRTRLRVGRSASAHSVEHVEGRYELRESGGETDEGDLEIEDTESDELCP